MLSVAVDVQGPEAVSPWVKKYGVTFPVAVDRADAFGAAFGLKAIPVSFLVDEVGIIRLQGGGPSTEFCAAVEEILREPLSAVRGRTDGSLGALSLEELRTCVSRNPDDAEARLALAQALERAGDFTTAIAECEAAARLRPADAMILCPADAMIRFTHGLALLRQGKTNEALSQLTQARDLDSSNWRIRKQIWAIQHPEKFYGPNGIDWSWQKEQIAREKK